MKLLALFALVATVSAAELPQGYYSKEKITVSVRKRKAIFARSHARSQRSELVSLAENACHEIDGEFVVHKTWVHSKRVSHSRYEAKATAVVSCN